MAKTKTKKSDKPKKSNIKKKLAESSRGMIRRLKEGERTEVRFLFEMEDGDGWASLFSLYKPKEKRSYHSPDKEDLEEMKRKKEKVRESWYAIAYDVKKKRVEVWELRTTMLEKLNALDEEYGTLTDRNYRLKREGQGLDTDYTPVPMDKKKMSAKMEEARDKAAKDGLMSKAIDYVLAYNEMD